NSSTNYYCGGGNIRPIVRSVWDNKRKLCGEHLSLRAYGEAKTDGGMGAVNLGADLMAEAGLITLLGKNPDREPNGHFDVAPGLEIAHPGSFLRLNGGGTLTLGQRMHLRAGAEVTDLNYKLIPFDRDGPVQGPGETVRDTTTRAEFSLSMDI
ncbi:MAG: hypothetical protein AAB425_08665, partial [Bdellovibrionota bacterium]